MWFYVQVYLLGPYLSSLALCCLCWLLIFLGVISIEIWCLHGTFDIKLSDITVSAIYQQRYYGVPIFLRLLTYLLEKDKLLLIFFIINGSWFSKNFKFLCNFWCWGYSKWWLVDITYYPLSKWEINNQLLWPLWYWLDVRLLFNNQWEIILRKYPFLNVIETCFDVMMGVVIALKLGLATTI